VGRWIPVGYGVIHAGDNIEPGISESMNEQEPNTSTVLIALASLTEDFDRELWLEQDLSCIKCHQGMSLNPGCEWPDDPRLLLCGDCAVDVLQLAIQELEAP
jgi:hypothetical protein